MAGIYLHIPFCKRRCIYCDFYSTTQSGLQQQFVDALCAELKVRTNYLKGEEIQTIYLGGGTPSQLSHEQLRQILDVVFNHYSVSPNAEITIEANPDDLTTDYVQGLTCLPFNRLSMGIQTFDDGLLKLLHRRHSASQALEAYQRCLEAGITNVSIDLIYGLPGQTLEMWKSDLTRALSLHPKHFSAYHLTYEEGTPLWRLRNERKVNEVNEEQSVAFFRELISQLRDAGYEHYEISNFCLPGFHSRHNSSYWENISYLGCGPSAHSYDGVSRQWNKADLSSYLRGAKQGDIPHEREELSLETRYNECIMTGLRTMKGLSLARLKQLYGISFHDYCLKEAQGYLQKGLLTIENDFLRLTDQGIFVSDGIIADLLFVAD